MRARRLRDAVPEHYTEQELEAAGREAMREIAADLIENELMPMPATCPRGCGGKVFGVFDAAGQPCTVERDDRYGPLLAAPLGDETIVAEGEPQDDTTPRYRFHTNGERRGRVTLMRNVCGKSLDETVASTFDSGDE